MLCSILTFIVKKWCSVLCLLCLAFNVQQFSIRQCIVCNVHWIEYANLKPFEKWSSSKSHTYVFICYGGSFDELPNAESLWTTVKHLIVLCFVFFVLTMILATKKKKMFSTQHQTNIEHRTFSKHVEKWQQSVSIIIESFYYFLIIFLPYYWSGTLQTVNNNAMPGQEIVFFSA